MDVTPLIRLNQQVIQSYNNGCFKVSGNIYNTAVLVFPSETREWGITGSIEELRKEDFLSIISDEYEVDIILLGCGNSMRVINPAIKDFLKLNHMIVETMDTGAACRTYNILMAEGRRVVAAMVPYLSSN